MNTLELEIEAIIFATESPVTIQEISSFYNKQEANIDEKSILNAINVLKEKYIDKKYSFELVYSGGGFQFLTKEAYHEKIAKFLNQKVSKRLSSSSMETLSIIAYKQPTTKLEIEQIRGVSSDYSVHKLLEKGLISILGKADSPGKPLLYGVSDYFLDYFGLNSPDELPKIKEVVPQEDSSIGEAE